MADPITPEQIAELERLEQAATPVGWSLCHHWKVDHCGCGFHRGYIWSPDEECVLLQMGCGMDEGGQQPYPDVGQDGMRADARLIAALRNAAPALLQAARELARLKDACKEMAEWVRTAKDWSDATGRERDRYLDALKAEAVFRIGDPGAELPAFRSGWVGDIQFKVFRHGESGALQVEEVGE